MSEKINEIEVLKKVDELLSNLSDEERGRIFDYTLAKYKVQSSKMGTSTASSKLNPPDFDTMSIKEFMTAKKPNGFYERVTCLAYYLEKIQGLEGFKTVEITQANKDARLSPMSNPTFFVNDAASKYGFLTPIGNAKKALSPRGEALVEALPDRQKVNEVLEEFPVKRKASKKSAKPKSVKS